MFIESAIVFLICKLRVIVTYGNKETLYMAKF
jgi:hypothetical protein